MFRVWHRRQILDLASFSVESVQLRPLVSALIHPENQLRSLRRPRGERDSLLVERSLFGPGLWLPKRPDLSRAGRIHQKRQPLALGTERRAVGASDVEIAFDVIAHTDLSRLEAVVVWVPVRSSSQSAAGPRYECLDCFTHKSSSKPVISPVWTHLAPTPLLCVIFGTRPTVQLEIASTSGTMITATKADYC